LLTLGLPSELGSGAAVDPRELHQRAFDGFRQLCAYCQAEAPLCFVLDDLQWADEESVALLAALLDGGAGRIMILGLFREEGLHPDHPLHRLLGGLRADGRATRLSLSALGRAEAARLVDAVTDHRLDRETADVLASQVEGNPFLVRSLAEHLAALTAREQTV